MHPLDNPKFGSTINERIWYLAHPLATDEHFTFEQNMEHVIHVMRICFSEGFRVIAPYYEICKALSDRSDENSRIGLEMDLQIVSHFPNIILAGHKISRGMNKEYFTSEINFGRCIGLVGLSDDKMHAVLAARRNFRFSIPEAAAVK